MLLETDFNSNREEKVVLEIDREQQEKLPIDMSSFPFMFKMYLMKSWATLSRGTGTTFLNSTMFWRVNSCGRRMTLQTSSAKVNSYLSTTACITPV